MFNSHTCHGQLMSIVVCRFSVSVLHSVHFCALISQKKMYQRWPFFLLHGPAYTWKQHAFVPKCLCTVCRVHLYIEILCGRQALGFACLHAAQSNLSSTGFLAVDTFRFQSHEPVIIRFHCDTLISCRGRCRESCNSM